MQHLLTFHGEMRWLVALAGAALLVRSAAGWATGGAFGKADRILTTVFTILLDVNLLLGLTLLLFLPGGFTAPRVEHAVTMFLAVIVAHLSVMWRSSEDAKRKFRNNLAMAAAVLVLVAIGVLRLRGSWIF